MFELMFYGFLLLAIAGGVGILLLSHPLYCAFSFLITLLSIAGIYAIYDAKLLFIMQIIVYAGAIMVLIVFIMMYLNNVNFKENKFYVFLAVLVFAPIAFFAFASLSFIDPNALTIPKNGISIKDMGISLFINLALPFEFLSVLLLLVAIGVITLLKNKEKENV